MDFILYFLLAEEMLYLRSTPQIYFLIFDFYLFSCILHTPFVIATPLIIFIISEFLIASEEIGMLSSIV